MDHVLGNVVLGITSTWCQLKGSGDKIRVETEPLVNTVSH
jgi:hypothetical protein